MKIFIFLTIIFTTSGIMLSSCAKESEEELMGDQVFCADTNVSYTNNIQPILQNNCYECHSTAIATNGIILDTYVGVTTAINDGYVLPQIKHEVLPNMPYGRPKLNDCIIETIEQWVDEGMQNN